jgi:glycosyltransferase involved in cell wall biosynthesis
MREIFTCAGIEARLHIAGILQQQPLADALHAMDVFTFASRSETQGMVLTEAMAAGLPVVALDAPGAREVVKDMHNGRLLQDATTTAFSAALHWVTELAPEQLHDLKQAVLETAAAFSMPRSAEKALEYYSSIILKQSADKSADVRDWEDVITWIMTEWDILKSVAGAGDAALDTGLVSEKKN